MRFKAGDRVIFKEQKAEIIKYNQSVNGDYYILIFLKYKVPWTYKVYVDNIIELDKEWYRDQKLNTILK